MDESLKIKSTLLKDFDIRYCIICQKKDSQGLASTANGTLKLMEAARLREDEVWNRLQSTCAEEQFVYHVDNQCYKKYVLKKALENILVLIFVSEKFSFNYFLIPFEETQYLNRYLLYLFLLA